MSFFFPFKFSIIPICTRAFGKNWRHKLPMTIRSLFFLTGDKQASSYVFLRASEENGLVAWESPSFTYLQDFPCDKLVTGFTLHSKEPLVVLFTVWGTIPARQNSQLLRRGSGGWGKTPKPDFSELFHRRVEFISPFSNIQMSGDMVRHSQNHRPQGQLE